MSLRNSFAVFALISCAACITVHERARRGDTDAMVELVLLWAEDAPAEDVTMADKALQVCTDPKLEPRLRALSASERPRQVRMGAARALAAQMAERPDGLDKCVAEEQDPELVEACMQVAAQRGVKLASEVLERLAKGAAGAVSAAARRMLGIGNPLAELKGAAAEKKEGEAGKKEEESVPPWERQRKPPNIFQRHPKKSLVERVVNKLGKTEAKTASQRMRESLESAMQVGDFLPQDKPDLKLSLADKDRTVQALSAAALLMLEAKK